MRLLSGLCEIAADFDGIAMDLWGCLHDGIRAYPAALDCLRRLRRADMPVVLLSNAPRRAASVPPRLAALGIAPDLYDGLYTSGELAWEKLKERRDPVYRALGRRVYPILAEADRPFLAGLDLIEADDIAMADFLLVLGVEAGQAVADFRPHLERALARGLPLVCANPDLLVHRGGVAEPCAGAIGAAYEAMGGKALYEGKPHPDIYRRLAEDLRLAGPGRLLCVGDSLRTDIAGANRFGAASLLIAGGIHGGDLLDAAGALEAGRLAGLARDLQARPDFALPRLAW